MTKQFAVMSRVSCAKTGHLVFLHRVVRFQCPHSYHSISVQYHRRPVDMSVLLLMFLHCSMTLMNVITWVTNWRCCVLTVQSTGADVLPWSSSCHRRLWHYTRGASC